VAVGSSSWKPRLAVAGNTVFIDMKKIPLILFSVLFLMVSWTNMGLHSRILPGASLFLEKYLSLNEPALNPEAFRFGLIGFEALQLKGLNINDSLLTIIDFSLPSSQVRLFVINLMQNRVLFKSLVSHGQNSGDLYATRFSNKKQSHESALGFFVTGKTYLGGQGYSLQLLGVDTGYNDHSLTRGIVIHAAKYATREYVTRYGRLGRSFGCPALPPALSRPIINLIKDGSVLFSYYPDKTYIAHSVILNGEI
jgi:hypothetical protein